LLFWIITVPQLPLEAGVKQKSSKISWLITKGKKKTKTAFNLDWTTKYSLEFQKWEEAGEGSRLMLSSSELLSLPQVLKQGTSTLPSYNAVVLHCNIAYMEFWTQHIILLYYHSIHAHLFY